MRYERGNLTIANVAFSDEAVRNQLLGLVPTLGQWSWIDCLTGKGQRSGKTDGKSFQPEDLPNVSELKALADQALDSDSFISALKKSQHAAVNEFAAKARVRVAGTDEPVKLAEYADKAVAALAINAGSASAAQIEEAETEAALFGLANANAMAAVWLDRAERLRRARAKVNKLARDAHTAIDAENNGTALLALGGQLTIDATAELLALLEN